MSIDSIKNCLDEQGRVKVWPKKHVRKEAIIRYIAGKFEYGKIYTEKEVNTLLEQWHTFGDYFLLRRSLIESNLMKRDPYGRAYERVSPYSDVIQLVQDQYGLSVLQCERASLGAGSETYFIECPTGKYVVKFPSISQINHPEQEIDLCRYLLSKGIPVSRFLYNNRGHTLTYDANGRFFHVQEFIDGVCPALNTASDLMMKEMAAMLGRIHNALQDYPLLPVGIGEDFFRFMTPERALASYESSLRIAENLPDASSVSDLLWRIDLVKRLPEFEFSQETVSCGNTHGDYFINQLICQGERIEAVIDWTTACVHPYIWEIIRSFVYASPACKDGEIDAQELSAYITEYRKYFPITQEDISRMLPLFFRQLAVCDYYGQYYAAEAKNREIYLHQAQFSTKLLRHLEQNMDAITEYLLNTL